ncbi:MAG TPA: IS30 family transposase [Streptosporangiaceae bacterium]|nr:IS30 family transposase [Streptosporangiaceae bacterium]
MQAGGVTSNGPGPETGRYLTMGEREEIAVGRAAGHSVAVIAAALGRPRCTIYRELGRNSGAAGYRATIAQRRTGERRRRPKQAKIAASVRLRAEVAARLGKKWSPRQIAATLKQDFPDDPGMHVSHETIYQSLYVQGRGALRRELAACLRTGRALRKPRRKASERRGRIPGMVMISERPAEAADRAVPGHWEGDLIMGAGNRSAIGTLVERTTRYCLLLHLPAGHDPATVAAAMTATISTLPAMLRRSMTWDQGKEMIHHAAITLATGLQIYFCDPHSPWQRGSNENTNGLLRQYFPKHTSLAHYTRADLQAVALELNDRPRQTLGWRSPAQALTQLLSDPDPVATTG